MRSADAWALAIMLVVPLGSTRLPAQTLVFVHQQRYCMGTMFDIGAYHPSRPDAERAIEQAMEEIDRLDRVMSHFKPQSDLSKLNREGRDGYVRVDPSLFEVIQESLSVSRRSAGKFDVTIAPLVRTWKEAQAEGRAASEADVTEARRCVGYQNIETASPDRIRFRSSCLEIELGGIGKGYAVERVIALLKAAGIRHAVVNAGGSSIASIGSPPGELGWPVRLGAGGPDDDLLLRDSSISTSQQDGGIIDPETAAPTPSRLTVTVFAASATLADALSTTLLLMSRDEGTKLLEQFPGVSARWLSDAR